MGVRYRSWRIGRRLVVSFCVCCTCPVLDWDAKGRELDLRVCGGGLGGEL